MPCTNCKPYYITTVGVSVDRAVPLPEWAEENPEKTGSHCNHFTSRSYSGQVVSIVFSTAANHLTSLDRRVRPPRVLCFCTTSRCICNPRACHWPALNDMGETQQHHNSPTPLVIANTAEEPFPPWQRVPVSATAVSRTGVVSDAPEILCTLTDLARGQKKKTRCASVMRRVLIPPGSVRKFKNGNAICSTGGVTSYLLHQADLRPQRSTRPQIDCVV